MLWSWIRGVTMLTGVWGNGVMGWRLWFQRYIWKGASLVALFVRLFHALNWAVVGFEGCHGSTTSGLLWSDDLSVVAINHCNYKGMSLSRP